MKCKHCGSEIFQMLNGECACAICRAVTRDERIIAGAKLSPESVDELRSGIGLPPLIKGGQGRTPTSLAWGILILCACVAFAAAVGICAAIVSP